MQYAWILEGLHVSYHKFTYTKLHSTLSDLREFPDLIWVDTIQDLRKIHLTLSLKLLFNQEIHF